MNIDPRTNVVVFRLRRGKDKHLVGRVPTLAEDGVRQAWDEVEQVHQVRARHVVGLHAEWEPTPADAEFIATTFPGVAATHHFLRPGPDGWDQAFAAASVALRAELRPVLWSTSSPLAGQLADVPHWPVSGGRLHLALAVVTPTGTYHVSHAQLGDVTFDDLMADTCLRVAGELSVETREDGVLTLSGRLVAAVACLPDFARRLAAAVGAERLVVGLASADEILVAAAGTDLAETVRREVLASEAPDTELVPCVLSVEGDLVEVLVERAADSEA
ncbi:hypothetical protein [Actinophytocola sp. NPDC049390]|uniref:hypothetical protein n=1 Tax=Actinophytocola sp. NPDC049390 TaxID=3363894 RepID=UPI0037A43E41